ncbi:putative baseplate assembly protein [Variovorax sp. LjRoot84]|uniref:putative baseplate assembly protein n=1 Tax=Variovorax sp. LjRoot84 TaxID=3342340 RepID=UPI003ECF1192
MNTKPSIELDRRDAQALLAAILARRAGYTPEWLASDKTAGRALAAIAARYLEALAQRLGQVPEKLKMAFLDIAGLSLIAAQAARAPVVFRLGDQAAGGSAPARTPVGAAPPAGSSEQILFETERALGVTAGRIAQIVSLWPGRDEYIDHSAAFEAGAPVEPFAARLRQPVPHHLLLSHPVLLALSGKVQLAVEFELQHGAAEHLDLVWEYWDGETWRGFIASSKECGGKQAEDLDSTDGLTQSGSYLLEADCAAAARIKVNEVEGYWLRARLTEPLLSDPDQTLPEVDTIRLSSTVNGALRGRIAVAEPASPPSVSTGAGTVFLAASSISAAPASAPPDLRGTVTNDAGQPVEGAVVQLTDTADPTRPAYSSQPTTDKGIYEIPNVNFSRPYLFEVAFADIRFSGPEETRRPKEQASAAKPVVNLSLSIEGLAPDKAFADATALDPSKPFYPLGQQQQPGSTFYFTNAEAFTKPLAKVRIYLARTLSPQDAGAVSGAETLDHQVDWDYWNGRLWAPLEVSSNFVGSQLDLNRTEVIDFTVPIDMEPVKVNDKEERWVRVRLQSGSYGFKQTIAFKTDAPPPAGPNSTFTYVAAQPPVLAAFAIGYTWQHGPFHAERVFAYNDFAYRERTSEAMWPGTTFAPFERVADLTPTLYLGFDKKPPADQLGLFFDVVEAPGSAAGPALVWEYWGEGSQWRRTPVDDETGYLRRPGIVNLLAQSDDAELARFGRALHWLRARLKEDGPPGEPVFTGLHVNAVWASERHTMRDLPVGTSNGTPSQVFSLTQTPILAGERIEVRELGGARANVEWRILAMELWGGDSTVLAELEQRLARESQDTEVSLGPLRLRRNRQKQVIEAWVLWERREQLFFSGPSDRHYALDGSVGRLHFGDGENGRVPPAGAAILVREMSVGGGSKGNVEARKITQLLGVVPGIQEVFNPRAAEGGADGEPGSAVLERGPRTVRHRGRALAPADYEALAAEASPAVKVVRAIPGRCASGQTLPGWVTVLIVPYSKDPRPYPSFGLREQVRKFIEQRAPADIAALHRIHVTGPTYLAVGVSARIAPTDPSRAGAVEKAVRAALELFLHPLFGGPGGAGWELGRDVFMSDIAAELERTPGVDYIEELALVIDGVPQGESVRVADDEVVAAGTILLRLNEAER